MDKAQLEALTGKSWTELKTVIELYLNDKDLVTLPKAVIRLSNLYSLSISGNRLKELPETMGNLKKLNTML